jgi:hypothetical protein
MKLIVLLRMKQLLYEEVCALLIHLSSKDHLFFWSCRVMSLSLLIRVMSRMQNLTKKSQE